jgi:hypothetical protein
MVGSHTDVTAVPGSGRPQGPCLLPHDDPADEVAPLPTLGLPGSLLLVGYEASARARLGRALAAKGFAVTSVDSAETALAAETRFAYAVVEMRLGKGDGFGLIRDYASYTPRRGSSSSPITTASPARSWQCAPAPTTTSPSR